MNRENLVLFHRELMSDFIAKRADLIEHSCSIPRFFNGEIKVASLVALVLKRLD